MELVSRLVFQSVVSFGITILLIPLFAALAQYFQVIDKPDGKVKLHEAPIPYLGGVAVFLGFVIGFSIFLPFSEQWILLFIGMTGLLLVGLIDDLLVLEPYQKFSWQCAAAFFLAFSGFYLKESFFLSNVWGVPLSILWILSVVNAFNLIDVMDGLASTTAACATFSFIVLSLILEQPEPALMLSVFFGSVVAFLAFNKPPAKIYLGDAGSLMIGGLLATAPFLIKWNMYAPLGLLAPIIILAIPLLEVLFLVIIRTHKGIPFYKASPDHFSIYLRNNGMAKNHVLAYVFSLSIWLLLWSILFTRGTLNLLQNAILGLIFLITWFFFLFFNFRLRRISLPVAPRK